MKNVDVEVTVNWNGKKYEKSVTLPILAESMADFETLAQKYGSDEKKEGDKVIVPSEKTDVMRFLAASVQRDIEYGRGERNRIRQLIVDEVEGPAKTIAKTVKAMVDGGGWSESEAREFVITQRKAKGLPV